MARITRKELKADKFALEVEHTVTFFEEHRRDIVRYGGAGLAVVAFALGYMWYAGHQRSLREEALARAIQIQEAPVGPPTPGVNMNFPTQEAKDQAAIKAFTDVQNQYPGKAEGLIASYYLASIQADQGKLAEAEKTFKDVADRADAKYASLAKLSLAQIYFADGRDTQGENLLREMIAKPSTFVSTEQATITLARYLALKKPAEARKLLDPLRVIPGNVGQVALSLYSELPLQ